ncbi:MAG: hypothetical protein AAB305_07325 [Candidatus Zixiibacteriota bacterium]
MARACIILICLFCCVTCTEENTYISNPDSTVRLSGSMRAWVCGIGPIWEYPDNPRPFVEAAAYKPKFEIFYANGFKDSFTIDDNSQYSRYIGPGPFTLVMSNSYSWPPDTLHMSLEKDSVLDFDVLFQVVDPETLIVTLSSIWSLDTARPRREWETIARLSGAIGGGLKMPSSGPIMEWRTVTESGGKFYIRWTIPVSAPRFNVIRVYDLAVAAIAADSARFGKLSVWANGFYLCMGPEGSAKLAPGITLVDKGKVRP